MNERRDMHGTTAEALSATLPDLFPSIRYPMISLMRAYTNDVYRVVAGEGQFALKIYGHGWRTDDEIRYEIDLLRHLAAKGIAVAVAIPDRSGSALLHLPLDGGWRQAVLFAFVPGSPAVPPFTPELYFREGAATARLHAASDDFSSPHARCPLDRETLIEQVRDMIRESGAPGETVRWLDEFGRALGERLSLVAAEGLDWGPCHGDLTFDNLHLTEDGEIVWYDFDSGGPGWRAMDLQGWVATNPLMQERQNAFVAGYRTVRPLAECDVAASGILAAALEFHGIGIDLVYRVCPRGQDAVATFFAEMVTKLDVWRRVLERDLR